MKIIPVGYSKFAQYIELNLTPEETEANDAWIDAIPDEVYDLCPCGCGKKFKFVIRENLEKHENEFKRKYIEKMKENKS